jgi:hypothetical protein
MHAVRSGGTPATTLGATSRGGRRNALARRDGTREADAVPVVDVLETSIWFVREGAGPPCLVVHGGLGVDHCLYRASLGPVAQVVDVVYYSTNATSMRWTR